MRTIYITVSVEDELPRNIENENYHCFQINDDFVRHFIGTKIVNGQLRDDADYPNYENIATHWLKPIQITESKFDELLKLI